jgi:hypothetical protein
MSKPSEDIGGLALGHRRDLLPFIGFQIELAW